MKMYQNLSPSDHDVIERKLRGFIPPRIFDIHAHLLNDKFSSPQHRWHAVPAGSVLSADVYASAMRRWIPVERSGSLFFGDPTFNNDRVGLNAWVASQALEDGPDSRSLAVVAPLDDQESIAADLQSGRHIGLKSYHVYSGLSDTWHAQVEEFTPEWMWEMCHHYKGILMLHIMRDRAIADPLNQQALRRLCKKYPKCRLVLAHIARAFNYRHALEGLHSVAEFDNVWVDTSAIAESPAFVKAIEVLGPERILFGTDYPISEVRGKSTAAGDRFYWFYDTDMTDPKAAQSMNLCGIESLVALREACESKGLSQTQIEGIFHDNAFNLLAPHRVSPAKSDALPEAACQQAPSLNGHVLVK